MAIRHDSLDAGVRARMQEELQRDIEGQRLSLSPRLNAKGIEAWPLLLQLALRRHDDVWLAQQIRTHGLLKATERRRTSSGGMTVARVPNTAAETLAEGDFNRYYVRGLCLQVLAEGERDVEVYRGKEVMTPRPESLLMLGKRLSAEQLLGALRHSASDETVLGVLLGPNSGLSVRRLRSD
ncbi:hypothetical protein GCM10027040_22630 [Halomonas shantousis]